MSAHEVFLPLSIIQIGYVQQLQSASLNYPSAAQVHAAQHAMILLREQAKRIQKTEKSAASAKVGKDGGDREPVRAKGKAKSLDEFGETDETSATTAHDESPWSGKFVDRTI